MAILLTGLVFGSGLALNCASASAQIVSVLDERGQRVYINTAPQPARAPESAKSAAPAANSAPGATKDAEIASALNRTSVAAPRMATTSSSISAASHVLSSPRLEELVQTTANRHGVDPNLVRAVIETESGGNPSAVSRKGAVGLMQLMPTTALELGVRNMFSAQENLEAGVRYLQTLLVRYGGDLDRALAAYNAGAGAVDRAGGVPKYRETRDYVRKVTSSYFAADAGRPLSAPNTSRSGLSAVGTSSPLKTAAQPPAKTPPLVQPSNRIYKTTDAAGHTVWAN